jgi:hypothetical protein
METVGVIEAFDVGEQVAPGLMPGGIDAVVHTLGFESVEEAFHRCIFPAIAFPAHGGKDVGGSEYLAISFGRVLNPTIRMVNKTNCGALPLEGHRQRVESNFRVECVAPK